MPIQVVMGFDGSSAASAAIEVGAELLPGARVSIVHLWTPPFASEVMRRRLWNGTRNVNDFVAAIECEGEREAERVARIGVTLARAAGWDAEAIVRRCYGGEGLELTQLAEKVECDMVVLGARGLTGARAVLGSVSDVVVHYSSRPVVVVSYPLLSAEYAALAAGPVVVGWDGSAGAGRAFVTAERLYPGRDLIPVFVADGDAPDDPTTPPRLQRVGADRGSSGRGVAAMLAAAAHSRGAALLVVGSRGRSATQEILLGSTTMATLHHAHRPVMVVPHAHVHPVDAPDPRS
jgi:nucleotide-binding universal stress UspA family protein